jgi:pyruvate/2-oxoglutarate dehydrogenase complex dihydrolipoamide dehydrogenase (E3) component
MARRATDFGVTIEGRVSVDMKNVKARKDYVVELSKRGVERSLRSNPKCTVYVGHARFISPREVFVVSEVLRAEKIFVNVGGRALIPDIPGLNKVDYFTNSSILNVDFVPPHLLVIGGSYIGLEFAQMYRRFGSAVTVIETASRLIPREDEDTSAAVADILRGEGIDVRLNAKGLEVDKRGKTIVCRLAADGELADVVGTHMLIAVGRRPNTDDLGLDKAGVIIDARGYIQVDDQLQTNVPGIWALGECNGKGAFTHTTYNDFEVVAANLLDNDPRRVSDRIVAYNLYTDPPLGRAGMTEAEVRKTSKPALIAKMAMENVSRAFEKGETKGFMKILVDRESKRILGASILGTGGDEVIHCILDLMYAKAPYTVMQRAMHIHPTVAEFVPAMLADLKPL